ncbi:MAG: helix-turn-helix domain-containing protein [Oscillospiraceae bacterium]|nr:helix-turn-helix domain-containing protein [Oscillospiraceae bacterium]
MNISICENLKELRKQKGNTQEELAEHLGISMQAVSKWERGEGYPDITLIPALALYYNVTSDKLLGMTDISINAKIQEYNAKVEEVYNEFESESERINRRLAICREAQKEFPNNHTVLFSLLYALGWKSNEDENYNEMIALGERLLRESTDNDMRFNAIYNLSFFCMKHGDFENAKKYADMIPNCWNNKEILYSRILSGEEAVEHNQRAIISYVQLVCNFANSLWANMQNKYSREEIIKVLEFILNLNRLVYPDGDFNNESEVFYNLYNLACWNLMVGNTEKALSYVEEMPEHFIKIYKSNKAKHTSFLVNKLEYGGYQIPESRLNEVKNTLQDLFENKGRMNFDCIRTDERYITAIDKMKTLLET